MSEEQSELSAGKKAGVTMADMLALPDVLRTIVIWLTRQPEAGLPEVAALIEQDEATTRTLLADLVRQGFVEALSESEEQPRYRVRMVARRSRQILDGL
ncbi:MAG: hypothetical protein NVSMB27_00990 [Ktedonobacteraceae bacterium]